MPRAARSLIATNSVSTESRDPQLRGHYLKPVVAAIPRMLAAVDLNLFGPSYGCCDRQYWHYRTAAFPSEMYQEAALPLALAYVRVFPGNAWHGSPRLAEAAIAAMSFSKASTHRDGSCDDYYPHERALGAAVFSLHAQTAAYRLLQLDDAELRSFFARRAEWIAANDESGRLANHHALAALALWRTAEICDRDDLRQAALARVERVLSWQSPEGWFEEYGGADPGYQTVTIDALANLRREAKLDCLTEALHRAVEFARWFQHPDGGYGGEYGSRGTRHFYPHGLELLAGESAAAAQMADTFLQSLADGKAAQFDDDRIYVHRIASLIEAYGDWSSTPPALSDIAKRPAERAAFHQAGVYVLRTDDAYLAVSTARGGTFHGNWRNEQGWTSLVDAGLVVEFDDGRVAVSQTHDLRRETQITLTGDERRFKQILVDGPLQFARFERATLLKQTALHWLATLASRWGRGMIRKLLQRRAIAAKNVAPVRLKRAFDFQHDHDGRLKLRIFDTVQLTSSRARVRRLAFAAGLQAAYTAAAADYHPALQQPWDELPQFVDKLNRERQIVVLREC